MQERDGRNVPDHKEIIERLNNGNKVLNFNLEQVTKTQRENRCIALLFL